MGPLDKLALLSLAMVVAMPAAVILARAVQRVLEQVTEGWNGLV